MPASTQPLNSSATTCPVTAHSSVYLSAVLCGCASSGDDTNYPPDSGDDTAAAVCAPEPPEDVLPTADLVIADLLGWEGASGWPDGCFVSFASWDEVVSGPDGSHSLVASVYCASGYDNLLVLDVSNSEFTAGSSVQLPQGDGSASDADVDADGWLHVSGVSSWGDASASIWIYDERTPDGLGSVAIDTEPSWSDTAWMGDRLFLLGSSWDEDWSGAYRFTPDPQGSQTMNDAEAWFPNWYSAYDLGDVDGDGLDDLVAYVSDESVSAVFVSSDNADAGPEGLPAPFAQPSEPDGQFFGSSRPAGDQDGDGLDDFALVEGVPGMPYDDPTVLHLFGGGRPERIAEVLGLTGLSGDLAYIERDAGPPILFLAQYQNGVGRGNILLQGPLCGTVDASAATTAVDVEEGRYITGWVGGANYVGQFTAAKDDDYDLNASLYIWE